MKKKKKTKKEEDKIRKTQQKHKQKTHKKPKIEGVEWIYSNKRTSPT